MVGLSAASSHGEWRPDPLLGPAAEQKGDDARQIGVRRRCAAGKHGGGHHRCVCSGVVGTALGTVVATSTTQVHTTHTCRALTLTPLRHLKLRSSVGLPYVLHYGTSLYVYILFHIATLSCTNARHGCNRMCCMAASSRMRNSPKHPGTRSPPSHPPRTGRTRKTKVATRTPPIPR